MEGILTTEEEDKGTEGFLGAQQDLPPLYKHFTKWIHEKNPRDSGNVATVACRVRIRLA